MSAFHVVPRRRCEAGSPPRASTAPVRRAHDCSALVAKPVRCRPDAWPCPPSDHRAKVPKRISQHTVLTGICPIVIALAVVCCACGTTPAQPASAPTSQHPTNEESEPSSSLVFALLADGAVVSFRTDGTPVSASPPAELPPDAMRAAGHDLAVSKDGTRVYALVPGAASVPDRIIVADRSGGAILARYLLADVGVYGALTVGPTSGHLYLFGNRSGGVLLSEVDPNSGMVLASWMLRGSDGLDWLVYQGAVVTDEQRVYVSYHGTTTTGIELV